MADLVIRGMEMPKVCIDNGWYGNCPMDRSWCAQRFAPKDSTNESAHKDQWNKLPSWCPLVPLPEGHGGLCDRDALIKELQNLFDKREKDAAFSGYRVPSVTWNDAICSIFAAPIIVPAEGGGEMA